MEDESSGIQITFSQGSWNALLHRQLILTSQEQDGDLGRGKGRKEGLIKQRGK